MKRNSPFFCLFFTVLAMASIAPAQQESRTPEGVPPRAYHSRFSDGEKWTTTGMVSVDSEEFQGERSLLLTRPESDLNKATGETSCFSPSFPVVQGTWLATLGVRTDFHSPDNSYNGTVAIEFLDASGKTVSQMTLAEPYGQHAWQTIRKEVAVPSGAVSARFRAQINKASGKFWIAGCSAVFKQPKNPEDCIDRIVFTTAQMGNLIYPEDPKVVTLDVRSSGPLSEAQREVSCVVRDYWGAEQSLPLLVPLQETRKDAKFIYYKGTVDLSKMRLEEGRYYELHGQIPRKGLEAFSNYTSFAILPEAAANHYKPEEIPFTSRTWNQDMAESPKLTRRLGIRICNVWGRMSADPAKLSAAQIDSVHELKMGVLTSSPAQAVESRCTDWQKLLANDGEKLRQGVRNFMAKYGDIKPMFVNLGNEPHSRGDEVKSDVEAYRIVYTELKKIDPSVYVVATSVGPEEEYFKDGIGKWCDAYDFHSYESPEDVRQILTQQYPALFRKYGNAKPIWSTEIGMNSQGMARQAVAALLYKKFANFFAGGGANVSWFGLFYPDPDGTQGDSFTAAHNVFDSRYAKYAPKLDAIAYYNAVNSICAKKFVEDKVYHDDIHAFLFRDRDKHALQICYKTKGREDVFIPMPKVGEVQLIRIDGSRRMLNAGGKGITLTLNEDPILLLYDDAETGLPDRLESPQIRLGSSVNSLVRGEKGNLDVLLENASAEQVTLQGPPYWTVHKTSSIDAMGRSVVRFEVEAPRMSAIREAELVVTLADAAGKPCGNLFCRPTVCSVVSMELLPVPEAKGEHAGIKLAIRNNGSEKQSVAWTLWMDGEQSLRHGDFTAVAASTASIQSTSGVLDVAAHGMGEVTVPISGADLSKVYRMRATARDSSGQILTQERPVAAFYGVPRASKPPVFDGNLGQGVWKAAPIRTIGSQDHYYRLSRSVSWKGPQDLSATIRYLWDEQYLYVGVDVTDDVVGKPQKGERLWDGDGLQFLIDPARTNSQKPGKYDYAVGLGGNGPQAWCYLSADADAPAGEAKDIKVVITKKQENTGGAVYEVAIPWSRLAPFKPAPGKDLGLTMVINDDDGKGRNSFMTWFGNIQTKDVDTVGDLILLK